MKIVSLSLAAHTFYNEVFKTDMEHLYHVLRTKNDLAAKNLAKSWLSMAVGDEVANQLSLTRTAIVILLFEREWSFLNADPERLSGDTMKKRFEADVQTFRKDTMRGINHVMRMIEKRKEDMRPGRRKKSRRLNASTQQETHPE